MADAFITDAIFLLGKGQGHEGCCLEVGGRTSQVVESSRADPKLNVLEAKHVGSPTSGTAQVFAGTEEEKEAGDKAGSRGLRQGGAFALGHGPHLRDNRQGQWFDAVGRGIQLVPGLEERA